MAPDKEHRIDSAVNSLIAHLIPSDPEEDEETAQERHDICFDRVRALLDK